MMLTTTSLHRARRSAFTLVEVLVAAGLCILIMAVMATAFQAGLDTLSQLRSLAGLQQQLRSAEDIIRRDLRFEHLESPFGNRVSDQRMDLWQPPTPPLINGTLLTSREPGTPQLWHPPTRGGFRLIQEGENNYTLPVNFQRRVSPSPPSPNLSAGTIVAAGPSVLEGYDPDTSSTRATRHILQMAVKLPGDRPDRAFTSRVPRGALLALSNNSGVSLIDHMSLLQVAGVPPANTVPADLPTKWAEVTMFLDVNNPTGSTPTNLPYFTLYRRVRGLMETDPATSLNFQTPALPFQSGRRTPLPVINSFPGLSVAPGVAGKPVNSAGTWVNPANRLGGFIGARPNTPPPSAPFATSTWWPFGASILAPPLTPAQALLPNALDTIQPAMDADGNLTGEDILLTNVLSFEVKLNWDSNTTPQGVLCGISAPFPGQHPTVVLGGNTVSLNNPEAIFDDLPLPSGSDISGNGTTFDGNPLFARMTLNAPANAPPNQVYFPGLSSTAFRNFVPGSTRRVFDTWAKFESPVLNGDPVAAWTNALPALLNSFNAVPQNINGSRRAYLDVMQGPPNPALINRLGRWDERYIAFDTSPGGAVTPQTPVFVPNPNFVPLAIRAKAIQIKIRVWDPKNNVARQITIVEDL